MITSRNIGIKRLLRWTGVHFIWLTVFVGGVAALYKYQVITVSLPWLPISVIGTALAFYVGFKNSQAYDRTWEARKIWGGIVNESRAWGMMVDGFVTNKFADKPVDVQELKSIKKRLIYRHLAWLYAHRKQLLVPAPWEHISEEGLIFNKANYIQNVWGTGKQVESPTDYDYKPFLEKDEYDHLHGANNVATQIINEQSRALTDLRDKGLIEDFRQMEMVAVLKSFYALQGQNERIKKFPLPRQYANLSRYFVGLFIILLPFSMVQELAKVGSIGFGMSIILTVIIGWIYITMELMGDYTENPFQGLANDVPMLSICRTIEIDLKQMLGEKNVPEPIQPNKDILL